jgi:hypothetical protein
MVSVLAASTVDRRLQLLLLHGINDYIHGLVYVIGSHVSKHTIYEPCGKI